MGDVPSEPAPLVGDYQRFPAVAAAALCVLGGGLTTGWAARLEKHHAEIFTPADVVGNDLLDVAHELTALPQH